MMDFYNMESSFSIVDISLKLPQMAQKSILFQTRLHAQGLEFPLPGRNSQ